MAKCKECGRYTRRSLICVICKKKEYAKKPEFKAKIKEYQHNYQKKYRKKKEK